MPAYELKMEVCLYHCQDVIHMETKYAKGHDVRNKYHICAISKDWHFFFINSAPPQHLMCNHVEIDGNDWPMIERKKSYVCVSVLLKYTEEEVNNKSTQYGRISDECMKKIVRAAISNRTIEKWQKRLIIEKLGEYIN